MYLIKDKRTGKTVNPKDVSNLLGENYEIITYNIPTKEQFCKLIDSCRDSFLKEEKLTNAFYEIDPGNALHLPTQQDAILSYLQEIFHDTDEWIYYYACDLEYGRAWKPGMIKCEETDIPLKTAEDLYNLLLDDLTS